MSYQFYFKFVDSVELHEELDGPQVVGLVILLSLLSVEIILKVEKINVIMT